MKRASKKLIARLCLGLIGAIFVGSFGYAMYSAVRSFMRTTCVPRFVAVQVEQVYCNTLKSEIEQFVIQETTYEQLAAFVPEYFYRKLKSRFKIVKNVLWNVSGPNQAQVTIVGVAPKFLINEKYVVGDKRRVFSRESFENADLKSIKSVQVAGQYIDEKLEGSIYEFLQKIPINTWDRYTVICKGLHEIVLLENNQDRQIMYIVDEQTFFDEKKMNTIGTIPRERVINDKRSVLKRYSRNQTVVYDTRFGDCVYVKC